MKKKPEVAKPDGLMDMKMGDVMSIVQSYVNQSMVGNMRKNNNNEIEINVDLNNTF